VICGPHVARVCVLSGFIALPVFRVFPVSSRGTGRHGVKELSPRLTRGYTGRVTMEPSLRARVLAEWRRAPEFPVRPDRTIAVGDGITRLMASLGLGERLREEEVLAAWSAIVGDFIATHSRPTKLQAGVLIVQVLQPTMHYELDRVWKTKILAKLKERFGSRAVKEIRFRVG